MRNIRKRISLLLVLVMIFSSLSGFTVFAGSLGDKLYGKSVIIGEEAHLANGVYWNAGYTEKVTENYIEYYPGGSVVPIISHGNDVHGAASFKAVAAKAASEGKYVVAGLNGDFFTMANGVPTGITIKDGFLISSESMRNPSVGFYNDGSVIIGRPNLNVRVDGPTLDTGIGSMHVNKSVTTVSGVMLYTRDYGNDDTNKANIPTYNVLLSVDTEAILLNGTVNAVVESTSSATGATKIPKGRMLLTMASGTEYPGTMTKLKALVPGDTVTLSFAADPSWNDVEFAIGGGDRLISDGKNVAPANKEVHPRTAVGIRSDGSAVFYTVDGRQAGHSRGATLSQLANRLLELGCTDAVNLDGGGSTAIHSIYPGENSLTTVNSPSQSALRNCANYILLINTARPTGQLRNLHLYPYSVRMLAGATHKFTIKGSDTNYYPMNVSSDLAYSATNEIGTFDSNNTFIAGRTEGIGEVIAETQDGARGSAEIIVVNRPDTITILNQADKKAVSNITVSAGGKIDLTASAMHNRLPLVSQDQCYTWSVEGGVGTIDEKGCFTAEDISSGTGVIKASAGGVTASVKVSVIGEGWQLETFENSTYGFNNPALKAISLGINSDLTKVRYGYKSAKVNYNFAEAKGNELVVPSTISFAKSPDMISFWVYGDNSGNSINLKVNTSKGTEEIIGTKLNFNGWKMVVVDLPAGATALSSINLIKSGAAKGSIYLDQFMGGFGRYVDTKPPTVQMNVSGQVLTATIKDEGDRRITSSKINLTYDGRSIEFQYDQVTGMLTSNLPQNDGRMHRIALTVTDESGNLSRLGHTIPKSTAAPQPFLDMDGHWASHNTEYLYERDVISGVNTDNGLIYNPEKNLTRAEFAVLMKNWIGDKGNQYKSIVLPFKDNASIPDWALDSVKAMYGMGIIMGTGTENGLFFDPMGPISRQEVMTIIGRTQMRGFAEADLSSFSDGAKVAGWALPFVRTLVKQQVIAGYSGKIWPKDPVTRAQVATIITNLY